MKPLIRWVGSKYRMIELYRTSIGVRLEAGAQRLIEPFAGAAAVSCAFGSRVNVVLLNDACQPLANFYHNATQAPTPTAEAVMRLVSNWTGADSYYALREAFNSNKVGVFKRNTVETAAQFYVLNHYGYNGLYRVNRGGGFNVPFDASRRPVVDPREKFEGAAEFFKTKSLRYSSMDFAEFVEGAAVGPRDVVYFDPPFDETFGQYTRQGFSTGNQTNVRDCAERCRARGATVYVANSDTPAIRALYEGWRIEALPVRRTVSCDVGGRGVQSELLISGA